MALPIPTPFNETVVSAALADISADTSVSVAAPVSGWLVRAFSCIQGAITSADATWVVEVNGTALTGTVTVANASSAAGDVDYIVYANPTWVNVGDTITFNSGGESSTTAIAIFSAVIRN